MRIRQVGADAFMVGLDTQVPEVLYVSKRTPRRLLELPAAYVSRRSPAHQPGEFAAEAELLPSTAGRTK